MIRRIIRRLERPYLIPGLVARVQAWTVADVPLSPCCIGCMADAHTDAPPPTGNGR